MGADWQGEPLADWLVQALEDIRILDPDPTDTIQKQIVDTLADLGSGATFGQRVVAIRWVFNWELRTAGSEYANAKGVYEDKVAMHVVKVMEEARLKGTRMSLGLAERVAMHEYYDLRLRYLIAEKREQAMRKFLDTLDAALENHRTDRADMRTGIARMPVGTREAA